MFKIAHISPDPSAADKIWTSLLKEGVKFSYAMFWGD